MSGSAGPPGPYIGIDGQECPAGARARNLPPQLEEVSRMVVTPWTSRAPSGTGLLQKGVGFSPEQIEREDILPAHL